MSNETLFFIFGIALAVSAVLVSFLGLKLKDFPGKAFPIVVLWFAILVGGATTFAVLHAKDEDHEKAEKYAEANKEIEKETSSGPFEEEGSEEGSTEAEEGKEPAESEEEAGATGPGGTLEISAAESELKFEETELTSKPGKVTIDFTNPSSIPHDVKIEDEAGEELGGTETIAKEEESATVELPPGTYKFFCSVPGHREAGMEGTLVVK
ncbi:MAG TPA: plastocyanin/azurin family copper-binding protein [Solirubrobacterales bacterium]|nr:plastocyanin/azurin family copper-binding protein [Solirubrobacterales bacterium]